MARINLLPWRAELRRQRRLEYLTILGACLGLTLLLWAGIHFGYTDRIAYQTERNVFLENETLKLDKQIKEIQVLEKEKQRLVARMKAIEGLQSSRPLVVHILDELVSVGRPIDGMEIRDELRNVGVEHLRLEDDELPFLVHVHVAEKVRDDIK